MTRCLSVHAVTCRWFETVAARHRDGHSGGVPARPRSGKATARSEGPGCWRCTPDGIRTRATALRGRPRTPRTPMEIDERAGQMPNWKSAAVGCAWRLVDLVLPQCCPTSTTSSPVPPQWPARVPAATESDQQSSRYAGRDGRRLVTRPARGTQSARAKAPDSSLADNGSK